MSQPTRTRPGPTELRTSAAPGTRIDTERHLSDQDVANRALKASFDIELLADAWRDQTTPENWSSAQSIIYDLEHLAGDTAAQRPAIARTLRTVAHDLRRAQLSGDPNTAYLAVCDAQQLVDSL